jgi:four helix bundle protein
MKEYLEQQLKKKAHELVMITFRVVARLKGQKGPAISLRKSVSKIPTAIFEGQARDFSEDKFRYFVEARNALFEAKYYLDLLYSEQVVTYYSYKNIATKLDLLDKMLISRIRTLDKHKVRDEYRINVQSEYRNN